MNPGILSIGGIVGCIRGDEIPECEISRLQANANIALKNRGGNSNDIGGLIGTAILKNSGSISNCASYLTVDVSTHYGGDNYSGAIGLFAAQQKDAEITNIFSKVKINKIPSFYYPHNVNAFAGLIDLYKCKIYKLENVFGYVEQIDQESGKVQNKMNLYETEYPEYFSETNCMGCVELPEDHGFDSEIWDLSDLSHPVLK